MDEQRLLQKRDACWEGMASVPKEVAAEFEREFEIRYIHNSTALEGNSMTLEETRAVYEAVEAGKVITYCVKLLEAMRREKKENGKEERQM